MSDFFGMNDVTTQIMDLIGDELKAVAEVEALSPQAAEESANIIAAEQRRIFANAPFKRDKPKHQYNNIGAAVIHVVQGKELRHRVVFESGFTSEDIEKYPELIEIEFGRPGLTPRYSGGMESKVAKGHKKLRRKGVFPEYAQVMPVRAGFQTAKEKAFRHYAKRLLDKTSEIYRR